MSALLGLIPTACVYDPDDRCGPDKTSIDNDRCVCDEGLVPSDDGCVPCGENEEPNVVGECVCVDGYARTAATDLCEPIPMTLGADCDTDDAPCEEPFSLCHVTEGTAGYCTEACSSDADCDGGYRCHLEGGSGYCRRRPLGYGESCQSDDDCAGGEATYCEVIRTNQCLVPCEAGKTDVCFEGEVCCNFVIFNPVCVPTANCEDAGTVVE